MLPLRAGWVGLSILLFHKPFCHNSLLNCQFSVIEAITFLYNTWFPGSLQSSFFRPLADSILYIVVLSSSDPQNHSIKSDYSQQIEKDSWWSPLPLHTVFWQDWHQMHIHGKVVLGNVCLILCVLSRWVRLKSSTAKLYCLAWAWQRYCVLFFPKIISF